MIDFNFNTIVLKNIKTKNSWKNKDFFWLYNKKYAIMIMLFASKLFYFYNQ